MAARLLRCLVVVIAAGIAGCAGQRNVFQNNPLPTDYKEQILAFLRTYLNDPTNVREARLSPPTLQTLGRDPRYIVCARFNPRNSTRRYMGVIDVAFAFNEGKLYRNFELASQEEDQDAAIREQLREVCKAAAYQPFPELEHLTR